MITYIKGTLIHSAPSFAIIETQGIGYKILIPASLYPKLPKHGSEVKLHTSFVIRENSQTLYGFISEEEREMFENFTTVTGIGPKIALSLIGHLTIDEVHIAVMNHDIPAISRVPGIGKKTAERLIIEMRDKFAKYSRASLPSDFAIKIGSDSQAQKVVDAMNALINLGYNQATAQKAVKKSLHNNLETIDLPTLITEALRNV